MSDDLSEHFRLSITVVFAAALIASVVNVTVMCMGIMDRYVDKYSSTIVISSTVQLADISNNKRVAAPIAYSSLCRAEGELNKVIVIDGEEEIEIFNVGFHGTNYINNLGVLITKYSTKNVKLTIERNGYINLFDVKLEVLD